MDGAAKLQQEKEQQKEREVQARRNRQRSRRKSTINGRFIFPERAAN